MDSDDEHVIGHLNISRHIPKLPPGVGLDDLSSQEQGAYLHGLEKYPAYIDTKLMQAGQDVNSDSFKNWSFPNNGGNESDNELLTFSTSEENPSDGHRLNK